jgi:RHS repeat-associated protein
MVMPGRSYTLENQYRYGFNGKELDPEGMGGGLTTYDYGFRIYNPAIARFLSVDPLAPEYPWYTPYQFAGNKPIWAIDLDGLEELIKTSFYNCAGELYKVEIQVIKATTDFGTRTSGNSNTQLVHHSVVIFDDQGNYEVAYNGTTEGVWITAAGTGALVPGAPTPTEVGGSAAFSQAENALIWNIQPQVDPNMGGGTAVGYPNSANGLIGNDFIPAGTAAVIGTNFTSLKDGIVTISLPTENGPPDPDNSGATPPEIHNTPAKASDRVARDGRFSLRRNAGKDYSDKYLKHLTYPIFKMVGRILDHKDGEEFKVTSESNKSKKGAEKPYTATYD